MKHRKKFYPQSQNKGYVRLVKQIFLAVILIFLFFSLTKNIFDYQKTIKFYQSFKQDYEKEKKKKITLQTEILKSQDSYEVEKIIRNKLNLLKDGEVALIIPSPPPKQKKQQAEAKPIYKQWIEALF